MANDDKLRWQALDVEDLIVVSSALQDGIVQIGGLSFDKAGRFFTLVVNRFRWELSDYGKGKRVGAALRVDSVLSVRSRGISRANPDAVAVLLAAEFTPDAEPPGGVLVLKFAGDGEISLSLECIDITLIDITPSRAGRSRPDHDLDAA